MIALMYACSQCKSGTKACRNKEIAIAELKHTEVARQTESTNSVRTTNRLDAKDG
jgi:hypothetical protein